MTPSETFQRFAATVARVSGRPITFGVCIALVLGWAALGPLLHFSEIWLLAINTGGTIVTFLMVFLIQNTQNREGAAVQAKLNEIIRAVEAAENRFIGIERLTQEELVEIQHDFEEVVEAVEIEKQAVQKGLGEQETPRNR